MKLKYYLRGLGVGILFASSILIITYSIKYNKSGIIERAKELGMDFVESTTENTGKKPTQSTIEDSTGLVELTTKPTTETEATTEKQTENITEVPTTTDKTTEAPTTKPSEQETTIVVSGDKVTFSVAAGMSSDRVAKVLEDAGLIEDWYSYNEFLVENGYARRIRIGTYTVDKNISDRDLAEVITRGIQ